jgi:hypothetical protein
MMKKRTKMLVICLIMLFVFSFSFFDLLEIIHRYLFQGAVGQITPPSSEVYVPSTDPMPDPPRPPPPPPPPGP